MRFIYIDSQGKEVSIPTVDALALRIELGAITESTRLFDEAADRWAPAGEHEIYRQLVRERNDKSGTFVAPPPPAPAPVTTAPSPDPPPPAPPSAAGSKDPFGLDFGLTLQATPAPEPASEEKPDDEEGFGVAAAFDGGFGTLELEAEPGQAPPPPPAKKPETSSFAGIGGLLSDDDGEDDEAGDAAPSAAADDGRIVVEDVLAAAGYDRLGDGDTVTHGDMELEQPLSELPLDGRGWTPRDRMKVETQEDEAAASRGAHGEEDGQRAERLQRPRPAPAPPPAPAKKASPLPALLGAAVVIAVVGGGGWLGWTKVKGRRAAAAAAAVVVDPPVSIPQIAPELMPRMRELSDSAKADWLLALRTQMPAARGIPLEPDPDWLAGSYLADASRYAAVERYWNVLDAYLTDVEEHDADQFATLYRTRLDSAGVTGDDAQAMLARANAGFLAVRPERRAVYRQLHDVVESALGLHRFLVANADQIEYDPAAGGASRDPVLEAVPSTPELGKEMWTAVDKITASLDALGALDKVTTDRLLNLLTTKLGGIVIR